MKNNKKKNIPDYICLHCGEMFRNKTEFERNCPTCNHVLHFENKDYHYYNQSKEMEMINTSICIRKYYQMSHVMKFKGIDHIITANIKNIEMVESPAMKTVRLYIEKRPELTEAEGEALADILRYSLIPPSYIIKEKKK